MKLSASGIYQKTASYLDTPCEYTWARLLFGLQFARRSDRLDYNPRIYKNMDAFTVGGQ